MNPDSIIVRCPNWIGDAVMATPALHKIRERFKNALITILAPQSIADLLKEESCIDRIIPLTPDIVSFLRQERFDLGILLTRSFSSAWLFWRGKVPHRIGFIDHFRRMLLTMPVPLPRHEEHDSITYQRLLQPFGITAQPTQLTLTVTDKEKKDALQLLTSLGHSSGKKLLVINPGAAYGSAKCWPKAYFREVIQKMNSVTCACVGDAKSLSLIEEITSHIPHAINLCNTTTIRELMAVLSLADCLLTNDSGPMHIGAALNVPLVALFGSTNPARTGPVGSGKVLYKKVPCSPCYRRTCNKNFQCMHAITPESVLTHIREIMS